MGEHDRESDQRNTATVTAENPLTEDAAAAGVPAQTVNRPLGPDDSGIHPSDVQTVSVGYARVEIYQGTLAEQTAWLHLHNRQGTFRLVYWDPPFFSGKQKAADRGSFSDRWPDLETYLVEMDEDFARLKTLVHPEGFLVLHCDWHASHYLKVIGDRHFGYQNFRNEIVWHYKGRRQPARLVINSKHDNLLVWAASSRAVMQPVYDPWDREQYVSMKRQQVHSDEDGREWIWGHNGRGRARSYRIYLDEVVARGRAIDSVWDMPIVNTTAKERTGYPTQKPVALLKRIVALLTLEGDSVADLMAGSGTTGEAAALSGRDVWLGDRNPEATALIQERMARIAQQAPTHRGRIR